MSVWHAVGQTQKGQRSKSQAHTVVFLKLIICFGSQIYAAFGLGASLKKVLNFSNMLIYAEYVVDDMTFPRGLPSIEDHMFQVKWQNDAQSLMRTYQTDSVLIFIIKPIQSFNVQQTHWSISTLPCFSTSTVHTECIVIGHMQFICWLDFLCTFQLGGDFVLDEHGRVLLSHCCQSPIDRPSVDLILSAQWQFNTFLTIRET